MLDEINVQNPTFVQDGLAMNKIFKVLGKNKKYCRVERNGTGEIVAPRTRPDHRKSKFGLRQGIKLNYFYALTKSEF